MPDIIQKSDIYDIVYPVGSIWMTLNDTNPNGIFNGQWEKIEDRFLLAASSAYPVASTGGEKEHTLTLNESPAHKHTRGTMNITGSISNTKGDYQILAPNFTGGDEIFGAFKGELWTAYGIGNRQLTKENIYMRRLTFDASRSWTGETSSQGSDQPHNNMPPYLAVNVWKRVA